MTDLQQVRLLISDTDPNNQTLTDEQIQTFLDMEGNIKLAAAQALETIATSEVLIGKVIKTQDLSTDGAKVAETLMKRADRLREQGEEEVGMGSFFDIVDFPNRIRKPELTEGQL